MKYTKYFRGFMMDYHCRDPNFHEHIQNTLKSKHSASLKSGLFMTMGLQRYDITCATLRRRNITSQWKGFTHRAIAERICVNGKRNFKGNTPGCRFFRQIQKERRAMNMKKQLSKHCLWRKGRLISLKRGKK
jgi:hypothetical protein